MATIRAIKTNRHDLTDYLIHFTRMQNEQSAFTILKSIITDGYIKSGWSQRSARKTVFGAKPAICFTETPLNGFLDYVAVRKNLHAIDSLGIFLNKRHFFESGGRTVIYGTTMPPDEYQSGDNWFVRGFPDEEQYRYILTKIDELNDWTHEREWRWANWQNRSTIEGLPLWRIGQTTPDDNYNFKFVPIGIIVKTHAQKDILLKILLDYYESERTKKRTGEIDNPVFSMKAIKSTIVIVLESIDSEILKVSRIEDILEQRLHFLVNDEINKKYNIDD